jgi:hypothetical protein
MSEIFICGYTGNSGRCQNIATHFYYKFSPPQLGRRLLAIYRCDDHFTFSKKSLESKEWVEMSEEEAATLREVRRVHES